MIKPPSSDDLAEVTRLLATPIDLETLVRDGVLEQHGMWYLIKDIERLPKEALSRAHEIQFGPDGTLVKFSSESARKGAARLYHQLTGKDLE